MVDTGGVLPRDATTPADAVSLMTAGEVRVLCVLLVGCHRPSAPIVTLHETNVVTMASPRGSRDARNMLDRIGEADLAAKLQATLELQTPEPKWELDAQLRSLVLDALPVTANRQTFALDSFECRASICRIETYHSDVSSCRIFLFALRTRLDRSGFDDAVFFTHLLDRHDGNMIAVTFFIHEGLYFD